MEFVNRYTRAKKQGKYITCPVCFEKTRVYHFSWSAITCRSCENMIHKYLWLLSLDEWHKKLFKEYKNTIKNKNYEL